MASFPLPLLKKQKLVLDKKFIRYLHLIVKEYIENKYPQKKIVILTLAHDGIPFAHAIAREINCPMYVINHPNDVSSILNLLSSNFDKDIVIIVLDDIYDTGATYEKYSSLIPANEWIFLTAKQNIPKGTFCPCVLQTQAYVVYPWEEYDFEEIK